MKNLLLSTFLFFVIHGNGQNENQLLGYVIHTNSLKDYHNVIVAEIDTSILEFTLRNIKSDNKVYKSIDTSKTQISLTSKEKKYILKSFK